MHPAALRIPSQVITSIARPSGSTSYQLVSSVNNSQLAYSDTGVQAGQTYDYIVESVDASGVTSAPSNMAAVALP